ncbi:hypothetical protein GE061_006788 [Apolygus lucorum]|uniref:CCHC-type domain-containing protein n=1 Tax=Apolygus lucorum TaxID=248454 RepID=A0A8S9WSG4_APOLU|nr:hypothetical protein GE061_006788 [Apolygus lucorum]
MNKKEEVNEPFTVGTVLVSERRKPVVSDNESCATATLTTVPSTSLGTTVVPLDTLSVNEVGSEHPETVADPATPAKQTANLPTDVGITSQRSAVVDTGTPAVLTATPATLAAATTVEEAVAAPATPDMLTATIQDSLTRTAEPAVADAVTPEMLTVMPAMPTATPQDNEITSTTPVEVEAAMPATLPAALSPAVQPEMWKNILARVQANVNLETHHPNDLAAVADEPVEEEDNMEDEGNPHSTLEYQEEWELIPTDQWDEPKPEFDDVVLEKLKHLEHADAVPTRVPSNDDSFTPLEDELNEDDKFDDDEFPTHKTARSATTPATSSNPEPSTSVPEELTDEEDEQNQSWTRNTRMLQQQLEQAVGMEGDPPLDEYVQQILDTFAEETEANATIPESTVTTPEPCNAPQNTLAGIVNCICYAARGDMRMARAANGHAAVVAMMRLARWIPQYQRIAQERDHLLELREEWREEHNQLLREKVSAWKQIRELKAALGLETAEPPAAGTAVPSLPDNPESLITPGPTTAEVPLEPPHSKRRPSEQMVTISSNHRLPVASTSRARSVTPNATPRQSPTRPISPFQGTATEMQRPLRKGVRIPLPPSSPSLSDDGRPLLPTPVREPQLIIGTRVESHTTVPKIVLKRYQPSQAKQHKKKRARCPVCCRRCTQLVALRQDFQLYTALVEMQLSWLPTCLWIFAIAFPKFGFSFEGSYELEGNSEDLVRVAETLFTNVTDADIDANTETYNLDVEGKVVPRNSKWNNTLFEVRIRSYIDYGRHWLKAIVANKSRFLEEVDEYLSRLPSNASKIVTTQSRDVCHCEGKIMMPCPLRCLFSCYVKNTDSDTNNNGWRHEYDCRGIQMLDCKCHEYSTTRCYNYKDNLLNCINQTTEYMKADRSCSQYSINKPDLIRSYDIILNLLMEPLKMYFRSVESRLNFLSQATFAIDSLSNIAGLRCSTDLNDGECGSCIDQLLSEEEALYNEMRTKFTLELFKIQNKIHTTSTKVEKLKQGTFDTINRTIKEYSCCLKSLDFSVDDYDCSNITNSYPTTLPECGCDPLGSFGPTCNSEGSCSCKPQFEGKLCNSCKDGYYNYPLCAAMASAMGKLQLFLEGKPNDKVGEPAIEQIPRTMLLEVDNWDPDDLDHVPIGTYFDIFDGITSDLTDELRIRLLRIKLRGSAKSFLYENRHLLEGPQPYNEIRKAMTRWYSRDDPEKAAARLWTIQKNAGESLRQFADRVRHTALQASRVDGFDLTAGQLRTWITTRSVKAFLKGLPTQFAGYFVNNSPANLEDALKMAEELEETLEPQQVDHWNIARVQAQDGMRRCYRCRQQGHFVARCPNPPRPPTPPMQRRNIVGIPRIPCSYCGGKDHFPAHCDSNPRHYPCDYCGLPGHSESDCQTKKNQMNDETNPMCDYCGYYGHLEADCPQKTESYVKPEPRQVMAITSKPHEAHPYQAVALANPEPKSSAAADAEKPDVCLPAIDSPFRQTMRMSVDLSGHPRTLIVDTGAQISVLTTPVPGVPITPTKTLAWGADGQPLPFLGQQQLVVTIGPIKLTHVFRIFSRDHSGLDLLGLDLLRRIPASIHMDTCEVRMRHPQTGLSIVLSELVDGYLSPARPAPRPDVPQPTRPRVAAIGTKTIFDTTAITPDATMPDDCPVLDASEEFPIEDLDAPIPGCTPSCSTATEEMETDDIPPSSPTATDAPSTPATIPVDTETANNTNGSIPTRKLRNLPRVDYQQLHTGAAKKS